jgi:hypothetical protein
MIKKKAIFRKVTVITMFTLTVGFMFPSMVLAQYREGSIDSGGVEVVVGYRFIL